MGQRSAYDPRDPWAFRNTWTGEIRNSYDDLWIWVTLIVCFTVIAMALLIPVLIHRYCRDACFCPNWCRFMDRILLVVNSMERENREKAKEKRERRRREDVETALPDTVTHDVKMQLRGKLIPRHHHQQIENYRSHVPETEEPCRSRQPIRDHRHAPCQSSYPAGYYPRSYSLPRPHRTTQRNSVHRCHSTYRSRPKEIPRIALSKIGK